MSLIILSHYLANYSYVNRKNKVFDETQLALMTKLIEENVSTGNSK